MPNQLIEGINESDLEAVTGGGRVQDAIYNAKTGRRTVYQTAREEGMKNSESTVLATISSIEGIKHGLTKNGRVNPEELKPHAKNMVKKLNIE